MGVLAWLGGIAGGWGVVNPAGRVLLWGSDFPHAESTWPKSRDFLARMFAGVPEPDLRKITSENAARLFGFELN
jgi:predicted TIM-barrel fold metal-dependent hydrolase